MNILIRIFVFVFDQIDLTNIYQVHIRHTFGRYTNQFIFGPEFYTAHTHQEAVMHAHHTIQNCGSILYSIIVCPHYLS